MNLLISASFIHTHLAKFGSEFRSADQAVLNRLPYDTSSLDVINGLDLAENTPTQMPDLSTAEGVRAWLDEWLKRHRPQWMSAFPYGQRKVTYLMPEVTLQCFRDAGLLAENPTEDIVRWWDSWAEVIRKEIDTRKLEQGRKFERKSFEWESEYLRRHGLELSPRWKSVEDNTAGYDIKSYRLLGGSIYDHFVEVKSSAYSQSFLLTRNEWETAEKYGNNYEVHFWTLESTQPQSIPYTLLKMSIPHDEGDGRWQLAEIGVDSTLISAR